MKKIFTFIAGLLLVCSGVSAQEKWTSVIVNGDMEGAPDPLWSSFWVHDYRTADEVGDLDPNSGQQFDDGGQFQGFAAIVEDPANPANHCAKVYVRTKAEAEEAGNMVADGENMAGWDTQFFIYAKVDEPIPAGKMLRVSMKIKAVKNEGAEGTPSCATQAHAEPGNYNHWAMIGNPTFTDNWELFEWEGILSAEQAPEGKGFLSIAFNLSDYQGGYTAYFDEIKMEIKDQGEPAEFEGWINFLRKGTQSAYKVGNYTTFTGRDGATGQDTQARIVEDPTDSQPALQVTTVCYNAERMDTVYTVDSETGDTLRDPETGAYLYDLEAKAIWIKENGDTIDNIDDWQTQFFVTVPHKFATGQPYKLTFQARADKPVSVDTQAHTMPGSYVHWNFCGSLDLTEDWQEFTFGDDDDPTSNTIASECNGCQTIAFNCNKYKDEVVNIYFRFDEFCFNKTDVTDNELTMETENIFLPLPAEKDKEIEASVDMTKCMEVLEYNDFAKLIDEDRMKVPADEETLTEAFGATGGTILNTSGLFDEAGTIYLNVDENKSENGVAVFTISNDGDALGENTVDTRFYFENDGFYYRFNVTFVDESKYEELDGISNVTAKNNVPAAIYNLNGQRLDKAQRGINIINGKKIVVK